MTKKRANTTTTPEEFLAPEPRRDRQGSSPDPQQEFLEEGVSHLSDSSNSSARGAVRTSTVDLTDLQARRNARKARQAREAEDRRTLMLELEATKANFEAMQGEMERLKSAVPPKPDQLPGFRGPLPALDQGPPSVLGSGTLPPEPPLSEDAQRDANRRHLMDKCSEDFRRRDPMKLQPFPQPFVGAPSQDLDEFFLRFEVRANIGNWTDQDKVMGLSYCLDKGAALAYQRLISNGELASATFADAMAKLRAMFPHSSLSKTQAIANFAAIKQRKEESIVEYAERFQTAMMRAGYRDDAGDDVPFNRFCESVRKELRDRLLTMTMETAAPHPLRSAIAEAMRLESRLNWSLGDQDNSSESEDGTSKSRKRKRATRVEDDRDEPDYGEDRRIQTAKRVVRAVATTPDVNHLAPQQHLDVQGEQQQGETTAVLRQVKALLDTTSAIATRMQETQAREIQNPRPRLPRHDDPPGGPRMSDATMRCYNCSQLGHRSAVCPLRRTSRPGPYPTWKSRQDQQVQRHYDDRDAHRRPDYGRAPYDLNRDRARQDDRDRDRRCEDREPPAKKSELSIDDKAALAQVAHLLRSVTVSSGRTTAASPAGAVKGDRPN